MTISKEHTKELEAEEENLANLAREQEKKEREEEFCLSEKRYKSYELDFHYKEGGKFKNGY